MKYFSVFSGVEGIGQGLDGEPVGFSEIDKYASMVLKYHYPNVKNYGNICNIKWNEVPDFDVLVGGSPCQDFSIAGKRKGLGGARSSLAWEFIRGLRDKQPRGFIWENVKGVMSSRNGWDFANLLCAFSESGYDLWWQVLNAKDFGVPQNRERIFVVGTRNGSPKEIFFKRQDFEKFDDLQSEADREQQGLFGNSETEERNQSGIENRGGRKGRPSLRQLNSGASQEYRVYHTDGLSVNIASQAGGLGAKTGLYDVSRQPLKFLERNQKNIQGDYAFTVDSMNTGGIKIGQKIRRLTPTECERLMSWPDNWTKYGYDYENAVEANENGKIPLLVEISDSQRYKMCGNGVVSACIKEIQQVLNF